MSKNRWFECNQCEKRLSSYKSLWRHKKICNSKVDDASTLNSRSVICSAENNHLKQNEAQFNRKIDRIINASPVTDENDLQDRPMVQEGSFASMYHQMQDKPETLGEVSDVLDIKGEHHFTNEKNSGEQDIKIVNSKEKIKNGNQKYIIVYGIQIPDKALTNLELSKYCEELNITSLRGIFARDSLPVLP